jgi:extracellular elastinolytic metalloproteinase
MTQLIDKRNLEYDRLAEVGGADAFLEETARVAESVHHTLIADDNKVNRFTGHLTELRVEGPPCRTGRASAVPTGSTSPAPRSTSPPSRRPSGSPPVSPPSSRPIRR